METQSTFSDQERDTLAAALDEVIPARPDGKLEGAGVLGVGAHIEKVLQQTPDMRSMIVDGLAALEATAQARGAKRYRDLPAAERHQLLGEQGILFFLMFHAYGGYYQHPRVLEALGLEARPPHPKGYAVDADDLSILAPVKDLKPFYRTA